MLNRLKFYELKKVLERYKTAVDQEIRNYKVNNVYLESIRKNYSDDYHKEQIVSIESKARENINNLRDKAAIETDKLLQDIKNNLDSWIAAPVDTNLLHRLQMIKTCEFELNDLEVNSLIKECKGNYMALSFLEKIVHPKQEVNEINVFDYYTGKATLPTINKPIKYIAMNFSTPDNERIYQEFRDITAMTKNVLKGYCGEECLVSFLPDKINDIGVNYGRPNAFEAVYASNAKIDNITEIGLKWANIMLKDSEALTDIELEDLKGFGLIDASCLGEPYKTTAERLNKSKVKELAKELPGIENVIEKTVFSKYITV